VSAASVSVCLTISYIDTTERMEYTAIQKGKGYVYAHGNQLYERVRTVGAVKYLKCCESGCDCSAKLVADQVFVGVSHLILVFDVFVDIARCAYR